MYVTTYKDYIMVRKVTRETFLKKLGKDTCVRSWEKTHLTAREKTHLTVRESEITRPVLENI